MWCIPMLKHLPQLGRKGNSLTKILDFMTQLLTEHTTQSIKYRMTNKISELIGCKRHPKLEFEMLSLNQNRGRSRY